MRTSLILRTSLLTASLAAALSAQAVQILLISGGTTTFGSPTTVSETVSTQIDGFGPLTSLSMADDGFIGSGTYTGAGGSLSFDYIFLGGPVTIGLSTSISAAWILTAGTGTYANLVGAGTLALTTIGTNQVVPSGTVFGGELQAVPEPASLAALALGGAVILRRRKKA